MDIEETYARMMALTRSILVMTDREVPVPTHISAELAETVQALDEFLSKNGFRPKAWHFK